jgi:hypothetical protein
MILRYHIEASAFAGAERDRATSVDAEADAGKESRAADAAGGCDVRVAGAKMGLHGIEGGLVDQRWPLEGDHLAYRLQSLELAALVESVTADIGRAGQDAVNLSDAPAPTVASEYADVEFQFEMVADEAADRPTSNLDRLQANRRAGDRRSRPRR